MSNQTNIDQLVTRLSRVENIRDDMNSKITHLGNLNSELNKKLDKIKQKEKEILIKIETEKKKIDFELKLKSVEIEKKRKELAEYELSIKTLYKEKTSGFPWYAEAVAEFIALKDGKVADFLVTKKRPSEKSAELVRAISKEKNDLVKQLVIANKMVKYYEYLFPFLTEFRDADIDDLLLAVLEDKKNEATESDDPIKIYITEGEYQKLSSSERNQKALDRYVASYTKSNARIGKDYERYVGHLYEQQGYKVKYQGIEEGFEDLGRDLICKKDNKVLIVQCKYWASHKLIHEKHINQLFGTTVKYFIENVLGKSYSLNLAYSLDVMRHGDIKPVIYTSTQLSETARSFANALSVEIFENQPMKPYPMIKCHISKLTGDKIYHLPFDQQYDRTIIDDKGEFYAMTVKEAEEKGFRRAWKWLGSK